MARSSILTLGTVVLLAGCQAQNAMPTAKEGEQIFVENCAACHNYDAVGGELSSRAIAPDLTQLAADNGGVFPRAKVLSKIDGYGQKGHANPGAMPEFGAILAGEQVPVDIDGTMTPTPRSLAALLAFLESIQSEG
ncbi:cytochrome c [Tropicibacter sp. R16_0]|uniref:c-type cytochrome n=1 Tax=Tropicibacter sp. R16_0 TaxID=2821102 RepID=UPI001ADC743D|nr:cytochrome c [Tropicibacter sp. R16_0]MBO9449343.1 cytochrome c [Tropicibacter sp. R16_0]